MPPSEYATGGGGKLKLKGSKVSDGRVDKKKRKSKKKKEEEENATKGDVAGDGGKDDLSKDDLSKDNEDNNEGPGRQSQGRSSDEEVNTTTAPAAEEDGGAVVGKTEAERKYEDAKKKRLQERLKREGVKTHKERVEELNKYLSRLSEHHDIQHHMIHGYVPPAHWPRRAFAGQRETPAHPDRSELVSYTLNDLGAFIVELVGVPGVGFLLAVFQAGAGVGLEHTMLGAKMAEAEAAVADDALGGFLAFLEVAAGLTGSHDAKVASQNGGGVEECWNGADKR
ncbi:uncharacterized protein KD926_003674 [Aspergillus affinis]|uniref:uncharacterized protein n=1 Tax=Aspergillus affinis TaxID=1070780 RepID=UPI0022FDCD9B|nr:uncharacterized protein KD926_003674 [Aspergillus affinis]KAI9035374.1 hypothetical protein KD926_003674 [Aspergillus affinis]